MPASPKAKERGPGFHFLPEPGQALKSLRRLCPLFWLLRSVRLRLYQQLGLAFSKLSLKKLYAMIFD